MNNARPDGSRRSAFFSVIFFLLLFCCVLPPAHSQDSASGNVVADAIHYTLDIQFDLQKTEISGSVDFTFDVLQQMDTLILQLSEQLPIDGIDAGGDPLLYSRRGDNIYIKPPGNWKPGMRQEIRIEYHGKPVIARRAPWDGGFVKSRDSLGNQGVQLDDHPV